MDKSDIEFLDNGNIKILGVEYTEGFFKHISGDLPEDKHIYLVETDGAKSFAVANKEDVAIFEPIRQDGS